MAFTVLLFLVVTTTRYYIVAFMRLNDLMIMGNEGGDETAANHAPA